ncbi:MAG: hypothetical protein QF596_01360 [Acidimicrobiales bacterium]|nr:hypothetical protein [Acidimicrobiales bacterium]MDP6298249.1 hypothetical protein [Acidimicrobiales bacterium]HJM29027.1 hypothetical protein [Acidimicrobiales bacterium]HJM98370.1 hypothetical protein [Acidimicrobiales bacterium]
MSSDSEGECVHDVKVFDSGNFLGFLSLSVDKDEVLNIGSWKGQILGSDYLVWGLNHRKVVLQFEDGAEASVVVRSGGRVVPAEDGIEAPNR